MSKRLPASSAPSAWEAPGGGGGDPEGNHGPETNSTHSRLFSSHLISNSFSETEEVEHLSIVHKASDENAPVCVGEFYLKDTP